MNSKTTVTSNKKGITISDISLQDCGGHRISSRSVSWNSTGQYLAIASSDRVTRLWTLEGKASEVLVVSGHTGPVQRARFHPHDPSTLCTASSDGTVRLWDVRDATQKSLARIDVPPDTSPADVEWSKAIDATVIAVTERDGSVQLYDTRKIQSAPWTSSSSSTTTSSSSTNNNNTTATIPLCSYKPETRLLETCIFAPESRYLVAAVSSQNMCNLHVWDWKTNNNNNSIDKNDGFNHAIIFPAHMGPIYSMCFSPNGQRLATGGSDAIVGLWNVQHMVCTHTISRCTKFLRSVSFSHDSMFIASSSDEDGIDLALSESGELIGKVGLGGRPRSGADEIAFHPKSHVLACARSDSGMGMVPAVTVAKLTMSQ